MNTENLKRMADYIRTIPQEKFSMRCIDDGNTACVMGHCISLDQENVKNNFTDKEGNILFDDWMIEFTGIHDDNYEELYYLFNDQWAETDDTPAGAAARIEYIIENLAPPTWYREMKGLHPLSYKK